MVGITWLYVWEFAAFSEQVYADCDAALAELTASGC
jgi:hypothetical protein